MRHGFERRQSEALVERRKNKNLRQIVKDAQHFDGDESQKAHVILHAAAHHGAPQVGIAGEIVANNDELEIGKNLVAFELRFERGEGFDHADDILVRTDAASVEQKWIRDLVALGDELAVGLGGVAVHEALVDGVVDDLDAVGGNLEVLFDLGLGEIGNGENLGGTAQHP